MIPQYQTLALTPKSPGGSTDTAALTECHAASLTWGPPHIHLVTIQAQVQNEEEGFNT